MINLFIQFLKIGFLGFGGGYAMLTLIHKQSAALGITSQQFAELTALDLLAPGPIAVNSATYVGYITYGIAGAILATLAVSTSSIFFSSVLISYEEKFYQNSYISKFLEYAKIAAVGMIASVAFSLLYDSLIVDDSLLVSLVSIVLAAVLRFKWKVNTILVLVLVGVSGAPMYFIV